MASRNVSENPGKAVTGASQFQEILLASVDLEDQAFVFAPDPEFGQLVPSLEEVGLLAPPWLRARADGRWQVVAGLKRLLAARHLGWERLAARTLSPETPDSYCLLIAVYDNSFSRGFNLREQAHLAVRLLEHWDRQTVVSAFLPRLGLPPSAAFLSRLKALAGLEPVFLRLAEEGRLSLAAGAALAAWTPEERAAALAFLENLWLSQSKQEQFLEEVTLLARREGGSPGSILTRSELQEIIRTPSLNRQEKTAAVRGLLGRWVSPRYAAAREAFQSALHRLGLDRHPRLRLTPPPVFEGPDFQLEIKFQDLPELQELLTEMARLAETREFSALTRL